MFAYWIDSGPPGLFEGSQLMRSPFNADSPPEPVADVDFVAFYDHPRGTRWRQRENPEACGSRVMYFVETFLYYCQQSAIGPYVLSL